MIAGTSFIVIAYPDLPPPCPDVRRYFPVLALGGPVFDINGQGNGPGGSLKSIMSRKGGDHDAWCRARRQSWRRFRAPMAPVMPYPMASLRSASVLGGRQRESGADACGPSLGGFVIRCSPSIVTVTCRRQWKHYGGKFNLFSSAA
jgi:hypothetical protein